MVRIDEGLPVTTDSLSGTSGWLPASATVTFTIDDTDALSNPGSGGATTWSCYSSSVTNCDPENDATPSTGAQPGGSRLIDRNNFV